MAPGTRKLTAWQWPSASMPMCLPWPAPGQNGWYAATPTTAVLPVAVGSCRMEFTGIRFGRPGAQFSSDMQVSASRRYAAQSSAAMPLRWRRSASSKGGGAALADAEAVADEEEEEEAIGGFLLVAFFYSDAVSDAFKLCESAPSRPAAPAAPPPAGPRRRA